jgi:hypothetical protein
MSLENLSPDAREELANLAQTLAENPETRKDFLRMTKKIKPDLPIPELEIEEYTRTHVSAAEARVQALEAKIREKDAMADLEKRRQNLIKKNLVSSEEEIPQVEKLMLEKGIQNHETAAEYHNWMKEAAKPTPSGYNPSAINKFDLSAYWKNPKSAAQNEAAKALQEIRNPRGLPIGLR